ncbi:DNA/RNA helicase domain-containing protein [Intrasporangium sp.]|uniref:DNA/RNA helicase domain-containing protein n=1 Tax=Intrasporangium sp. TaxID=1925024 RepID=UPI0034641BE3
MKATPDRQYAANVALSNEQLLRVTNASDQRLCTSSTRKELRTIGRPQVHELLSAARVPVLLLDQYQVVRPGELGPVEEIDRRCARPAGRAHQLGRPGPVRWLRTLCRLVVRACSCLQRACPSRGGDDGFDVALVDQEVEPADQMAYRVNVHSRSICVATEVHDLVAQ